MAGSVGNARATQERRTALHPGIGCLEAMAFPGAKQPAKTHRLLETLWRAGEISTTDYLLQVQQALDTQIAGIELHGDFWNAWLAWMNHSASLDNWLNTENQENPSNA